MSFALRNGRRPWTCLPAAAAACALSFALSGPLRAGEPGGEPGPGPLDRAEMMEREAHGLLEHGHRVEGARLMSKAWGLRAEAFAREEKGAAGGGDLERVRAQIEELKAKSAAEERAAHEAKEAGRAEESAEHLEAAKQAWQKATAMEEHLRRMKDERAGKERHDGPDAAGRHAAEREEEIARVKARIQELRAASQQAEEEGHRLKEEGKPDAAEAAMKRSGELWKEAEGLKEMLARKTGEGAPPPRKDGPHKDGPGKDGPGKDAKKPDPMAELARLRAEVADLRRALNELKELLQNRDR